jgi:prepilin-type N-terminal cleavage/methylation domain-containing protein
MRPPFSRHGFTLIELSIVLVIIGLIVGGVLVGYDLIKAAELRSVVRQIESTNTAASAFRLKYNAIPGDMRNATDFWGAKADCSPPAPTTDKTTCDGNGNRMLEGTMEIESFCFWQHLSNAELIPGNYTCSTSSMSGGLFEAGSTFGTLAGRKGALMLFNRPIETFFYGFAYKNAFIIAQRGDMISNIFAPHEAYYIDEKLDNGTPGTGIVQVGLQPQCTTTVDYTTAEYDFTFKEVSCFMGIRSGF